MCVSHGYRVLRAVSAHVVSHVAHCGFHNRHTPTLSKYYYRKFGVFARAVIVNKMSTESADGEHARACQGSSLRQWSFACAMSMLVASPVLFSRLQDMIAACAFTGRLCHT